MLTEFQLCRKREKKAMARKHKGYNNHNQFLRVMTQKDIKTLPPAQSAAPIVTKPSVIGRAVSFCRRMLGR